MTDPALRLLGAEAVLADGEGQTLFLNARWAADLGKPVSGLHAVQPERGPFLDCEGAGVVVAADAGALEGRFAGVAILVARQNVDNAHWLRIAADHVVDGGAVILAGSKTSGIGKLEKRLKALDCIVDKIARFHATLLRISGPAMPDALRMLAEGLDGTDAGPDFVPGAFNLGHADEASQALAAEFSRDWLRGRVADFGAGTGYLAEQAIASSDRVNALTLYESHAGALAAAQKRFAASELSVRLDWRDILREPVKERFDTIITNPPFHDALGRTDPQIGVNFLLSAFFCLAPRGTLAFVANRDLPYEKPLQNAGARLELLSETGRFKVLRAIR